MLPVRQPSLSYVTHTAPQPYVGTELSCIWMAWWSHIPATTNDLVFNRTPQQEKVAANIYSAE